MLIAMAIGVGLGWFYPDTGVAMQPLGDAFIKAIRMLIAPLIFCTVVHGIAHMADVARVGRVAIKAIVYFEVLTTIALLIGLVVVNLWHPGVGMNVDLSKVNASVLAPYIKQTEAVGFVHFMMGIIPTTFVGAFAEGNILQVLFISVLCGFALVLLGPVGKPLLDLIKVASHMIFKVVGFVMWAAPLGAFGAIAFTVGKFGVGSLASLGMLLICFYTTCLIFIFGVLGAVAAYVRLQHPQTDPLSLGRDPDLRRHHVVGNGAAAAHRQDGERSAARKASSASLCRPGIHSTSTAPAFTLHPRLYSSRKQPTRHCPSRSKSACC